MLALQALCLLDMFPAMINNVLLALFRVFKVNVPSLTCILHYHVGSGHISVMSPHHCPCEFNYVCRVWCVYHAAAGFL